MAVPVDQSGKQSVAVAIERMLDAIGGGAASQHSPHLPVVADDQSGEMLQLPVGADLHSIDVGDQSIGERRCRKQRKKRDGGSDHYGGIALFGGPRRASPRAC